MDVLLLDEGVLIAAIIGVVPMEGVNTCWEWWWGLVGVDRWC